MLKNCSPLMNCAKCGCITFDGEVCDTCISLPRERPIYLWDRYHGTRKKCYYTEFPRQKHQPIFGRKLNRWRVNPKVKGEITGLIQFLIRITKQNNQLLNAPAPFMLNYRPYVVTREDNTYKVYSNSRYQFEYIDS